MVSIKKQIREVSDESTLPIPYSPGEQFGPYRKVIELDVEPDIARLVMNVYDDVVFLNHMIVREKRKGVGSALIGGVLKYANANNKIYISGFIGGGGGTKNFLKKNGLSQATFEFWTDDEWKPFKADKAPELSEFPDRCISDVRVKKQCIKNEDWWPWGYSVWFFDEVDKVMSERSGLYPLVDRQSPLANIIKRRIR